MTLLTFSGREPIARQAVLVLLTQAAQMPKKHTIV